LGETQRSIKHGCYGDDILLQTLAPHGVTLLYNYSNNVNSCQAVLVYSLSVCEYMHSFSLVQTDVIFRVDSRTVITTLR